MDTKTHNNLTVLYTSGQGHFEQRPWQCPNPKHDEIRVASVYTGVCRSDIDMMQGNFGPLPIHMMGHEGVAEVIELGVSVTDVKIGDYVATRGEPAYAEQYCVRSKEYVKIPECDPKYILEPVACGINCITQNLDLIKSKQRGRMLINGTGFLARVIDQTLRNLDLTFEIEVLGTHNQEYWGSLLVKQARGHYDVVIDLSARDLVNQDIFAANAVYVYASQKTMTTDLRYLLWNAVTVICPSPRTDNFYSAMLLARDWVQANSLDVQDFWTQAYTRENFQEAFSDGLNRSNNYSRGYIKWR
jgi:D-arabinose 1-dehydrogenase-like Zn-dependent alcohol dehydrogenase